MSGFRDACRGGARCEFKAAPRPGSAAGTRGGRQAKDEACQQFKCSHPNHDVPFELSNCIDTERIRVISQHLNRSHSHGGFFQARLQRRSAHSERRAQDAPCRFTEVFNG